MPRIYTRTGDAGETTFFDGTRVLKSDPRVDACGDVDELASWLGLIRSTGELGALVEIVDQIQRDLFALGATLADPDRRIASRVDKAAIDARAVGRLEAWIDALDAELRPLHRFILAGGTPAGAMLHLARAVCRRAERRIVALGPAAVRDQVLAYVNRLSDLLFTMARTVNRRAGIAEIEW